MNVTHFLSELTSIRSDFLFNELVNGISVVEIDVGKVAVVKGSVEHDGKVLARTQEAGVRGLVGRGLMRMKMLHFISYSVKLFV